MVGFIKARGRGSCMIGFTETRGRGSCVIGFTETRDRGSSVVGFTGTRGGWDQLTDRSAPINIRQSVSNLIKMSNTSYIETYSAAINGDVEVLEGEG